MVDGEVVVVRRKTVTFAINALSGRQEYSARTASQDSGAVLLALVVFMGFDRGDRSRVYVLGIYTAVFVLCAGTVFLEVVRPAVDLEPGRFLGGVLRLDTRSGHFYGSARAIIAGYVAWVRFTAGEDERNLQEVHRLLTQPPDDRKILVNEMRRATGIAGSLARLAAERQMQVGSQEAGSNFSTIANQLSFLNYPELEANAMRSDFDPMELADGDVDLFVVVPEEMTEHVRAWLRLWVTIPNAVSAMRALERDMLIIVDEMPKLGYLKPVMDGYNLAAGRGVHFWCFAQSVSAWDATWGQENRQILVDLAELVQILGFPRTDVNGAEALSAAIGSAGFENRSESHSGQVPVATMMPPGTPLQVGDQVSVVRERVVTTDEILTMGPDEQYVIAAPKDMPRDAFRLKHARYWMRSDAKLLADPNPFVLRKQAAVVGGRYGMYGRTRASAKAASA